MHMAFTWALSPIIAISLYQGVHSSFPAREKHHDLNFSERAGNPGSKFAALLAYGFVHADQHTGPRAMDEGPSLGLSVFQV